MINKGYAISETTRVTVQSQLVHLTATGDKNVEVEEEVQTV